MFYIVMTLSHKSENILQFWTFRKSHSTYSEIQALWLVENWQQRINFRFGPLWQGAIANVWACNSEGIIAIAISVSQSVVAKP